MKNFVRTVKDCQKEILGIAVIVLFIIVSIVRCERYDAIHNATFASTHQMISYKGDTVLLGNIVVLPEYKDTLYKFFKKADKIQEFAVKNHMREFNKTLGFFKSGDQIIKFEFVYGNPFLHNSSIEINSVRDDGYKDHAYLFDMDSKYIYYITKYKYYQDQAKKKELRDKIKMEKIINKLNKL